MGAGKTVPGFSLNSFVAPKEDWYKNLNLQDIRDGELYKSKGYENIWECARQELNLTQSTASRYISICEKFSSDGDSPYLGEKYKEYGKSQLQELLTISDQKLIEQVTPDMSVKQIQKLKRENKAGKDEHVQIEQIKEQTSGERYAALPGQMQMVVDGTFRELEDESEPKEPESVTDTERLPSTDNAVDPLDVQEEPLVISDNADIPAGGYSISLIDKLILQYEGYQKDSVKEQRLEMVYKYNCLLDALRLLKHKMLES